jgi:hypothetical protein
VTGFWVNEAHKTSTFEKVKMELVGAKGMQYFWQCLVFPHAWVSPFTKFTRLLHLHPLILHTADLGCFKP